MLPFYDLLREDAALEFKSSRWINLPIHWRAAGSSRQLSSRALPPRDLSDTVTLILQTFPPRYAVPSYASPRHELSIAPSARHMGSASVRLKSWEPSRVRPELPPLRRRRSARTLPMDPATAKPGFRINSAS